MKTFRFQVMTNENYSNYMLGSYNYHIQEELVRAENIEEAKIKAKQHFGAGYVINENSFMDIEEYEALQAKERKEEEKRRLAEEEKARKAKERREQKEREKAEAEGLTLEEYKNKKKREAKIRKAERDLEYALEEAERAKNYLQWVKENYLIKK